MVALAVEVFEHLLGAAVDADGNTVADTFVKGPEGHGREEDGDGVGIVTLKESVRPILSFFASRRNPLSTESAE